MEIYRGRILRMSIALSRKRGGSGLELHCNHKARYSNSRHVLTAIMSATEGHPDHDIRSPSPRNKFQFRNTEIYTRDFGALHSNDPRRGAKSVADCGVLSALNPASSLEAL